MGSATVHRSSATGGARPLVAAHTAPGEDDLGALEPGRPSKLAYIGSLCDRGLVSANSAQAIAKADSDECPSDPDVARLATLGCSGRYLGICRRDLICVFIAPR